jgi:hypothetical protein
MNLGTWKGAAMQRFIKPTLADEKMRLAYD